MRNPVGSGLLSTKAKLGISLFFAFLFFLVSDSTWRFLPEVSSHSADSTGKFKETTNSHNSKLHPINKLTSTTLQQHSKTPNKQTPSNSPTSSTTGATTAPKTPTTPPFLKSTARPTPQSFLPATEGFLGNCSRTMTFRMTRGGLFVRLSCLVKAFQRAIHANRSLNIDFNDPLPDAREDYYNPDYGSDYGPWSMWFKPAGCFGRLPYGAVGYSEEYDQTDLPHVWMSTEKACNPFDGDNTRVPGNLLYQLNGRATEEIHTHYLKQFTNYTSGQFFAMHIRRGDKVKGDMKEAKQNHIVEYIVKLEGIYGRDIDIPVFVASDSSGTIAEIKKWRPAWKIWQIEDPDLKTSVGFSSSEFMKKPREFRLRWMRLLLAEFEMLRRAKYSVGSLVSHVYRFASWIRPAGSSFSVLEVWDE